MEPRKLDSKAVWLFFSHVVGVWVLFFLGCGFFFMIGSLDEKSQGVGKDILPLVFSAWFWSLPVVVLGSVVWAGLYYENFEYQVAETCLHINSGILWKKSQTIPYDRIQNIEVDRGLIARIFGLSDIQISTAGTYVESKGNNRQGRLSGLSQEVAEQLRDELIEKSRQSKESKL